MFVHLKRIDGSEIEQSFPRVTFRANRCEQCQELSCGHSMPAVVLGTLPDITVVLLAEIDTLWIEAD